MSAPRPRPVRYFHGGVPGLRTGDLVRPPADTGVERTCTAHVVAMGGQARADRVYVTSARDVARVFAALYPDGALYQVEPVGELVPDPDCRSVGVSWEVPAARVVRVVDPVVLVRARRVEAWLRLLERAAEAAGLEVAE